MDRSPDDTTFELCYRVNNPIVADMERTRKSALFILMKEKR